jgi:hypothetical protein
MRNYLQIIQCLFLFVCLNFGTFAIAQTPLKDKIRDWREQRAERKSKKDLEWYQAKLRKQLYEKQSKKTKLEIEALKKQSKTFNKQRFAGTRKWFHFIKRKKT